MIKLSIAILLMLPLFGSATSTDKLSGEAYEKAGGVTGAQGVKIAEEAKRIHSSALMIKPRDLKHEPRNEAEAQRQNKFAEDIKPAIYRQWVDYVASSAPEKQLWLRSLEEQLGGFYFPHYLNDDLFNTSKPYRADEDCWAYVKDDPALPRVLIIGDSISRAYTVPVRQALKGKANVHRAPANCGPTSKFLQLGEGWLNQNGSALWDFIIVNFGIHDGKNPTGYEKRLAKVIARLKQSDAKEIFWVRTTPWGKDASVFEKASGDASHMTNPISDRVASAEGLTMIDAHALMMPLMETELSRKDFTHWTAEAYSTLGEFVAAAIETRLPSK